MRPYNIYFIEMRDTYCMIVSGYFLGGAVKYILRVQFYVASLNQKSWF